MDEPSVLDYLKSKLMPWRRVKISIPLSPERAPKPVETAAIDLLAEETIEKAAGEPGQPANEASEPEALNKPPVEKGTSTAELSPQPVSSALVYEKVRPSSWPVRTTGAVVVALFAQLALEPDSRNAPLGAALYVVAAILLIWAIFSKEWALAPLAEDPLEPVSVDINWKLMLPAIPLIIVSFLAFGGNEFNEVNLDQLSGFKADVEITPDTLQKARLLRDPRNPVAILGRGEIKNALKVRVHRVTKSAKEKIEAAGGSVELIV